MLDSSYLSLIQDKYINTISSSNFTHLSDLSSLLAAKKTKTSSSDYAKKIVDVANADAQNDIKNGNSKSWQNSDEYLSLKDEYVESGLSSKEAYSEYSQYNDAVSQYFSAALNAFMPNNSKAKNDSYLTRINRAFAQAMNDNVTRTVRETEFDLNYNYAYKAYKSAYSKQSASFDVSV